MRHAHDGQPVEQSPDHNELRLRATVGDREEFSFLTADGVDSPDAFRTSELCLLDALVEEPPDSLLVPDANYGVVGTVAASFVDRVRITETSARAARLCRTNARCNRLADRAAVAITADLRALPDTFDAAALAPSAYEPCAVVEQRLADTLAAIEPGGDLYLAAAESAGLQRYRRTLRDLCEGPTVVVERGEYRVLRGRRPTDFAPPQFAEPREFDATIGGTSLTLVSYPGLFSATRLDGGTRALARHLDVKDGERVLDLACGYGPLGIYAALTADCEVTLTDVDRVASICARESAERSDIPDVDVFTADGVSAVRDRTFDRVVCNPPTHAGSGVVHDLLVGARDVLAEDGRLNLVHHRGIDFDQYVEPYFDAISADRAGEYRIVTGGSSRCCSLEGWKER